MIQLLVLVLVPGLVHCIPAPLEDFLSTPDYVRSKGYPCEDHPVVSPDGYILSLHRIPHRNSSEDHEEARPVVLLHHGFLLSSSCWVVGPIHNSLAFLLVEQGYDVWMVNARGNAYSKSHVDTSHEDDAFWEFSWDEMATKDLPAIMEYIQTHTGESKLSYVGHSMGTTVFFAAMAANPSLNERIKVMVALAPSVSLKHATSPVITVANIFVKGIVNFVRQFGVQECGSYNSVVSWTSSWFCGLSPITEQTCQFIVSPIVGFDAPQWDTDTYQGVLATMPAGTSFRNLLHLFQMMSGKFEMYDFGEDGNMVHYNQSTPPSYDLSNVTAPVAIYSGANDWLASPKDVAALAGQLPHLVSSFEVYYPTFNHLDFLWAKDVVPMLYNYVIETLQQHK